MPAYGRSAIEQNAYRTAPHRLFPHQFGSYGRHARKSKRRHPTTGHVACLAEDRQGKANVRQCQVAGSGEQEENRTLSLPAWLPLLIIECDAVTEDFLLDLNAYPSQAIAVCPVRVRFLLQLAPRLLSKLNCIGMHGPRLQCLCHAATAALRRARHVMCATCRRGGNLPNA
ncbi:hypothetical protein ACLKA6_014748 [Drosophila palustris]